MATKVEQWKANDGTVFEEELPALIQDLVLARNNSPKDCQSPHKINPEMQQALMNMAGYIRRLPASVRTRGMEVP